MYKSNFNLNIVQKVRKQRKSHDMYNIQIKKHQLIGKSVLNQHENWTGKIESVYKMWLQGWYYVAMINHNNSHAMWLFENIDCHNEKILEMIEKSNFKYKVLE